MIILAANIPDVSSLMQQHLMTAKPYIGLAYDNMSAAIIPIIGKIRSKPSVDTSASYSLYHGQSLTADQIDAILKDVRSPAIHTGAIWVTVGNRVAIDAGYMLTIFIYESKAATDKAWIGIKPIGHTYNIGNMICAGYDPNRDGVLDCYKGFRDYSNYPTERERWYAGIEDSFKNMRYYRDIGIKDFDTALMKWAPPSENNTYAYIQTAHTLLDGWRSVNNAATFPKAEAVSTPITIHGADPFGYNVKVALDANNGALRYIVIKSGTTWSFNETIGDPNRISQLKTLAGVYGGGWCDLACRYIQVAKGLGLETEYLQHGGIALNSCSVADSPYIWTTDGKRGIVDGRQDLLITNNTIYTVILQAIERDDSVVIIGRKESTI